MLKGKDDHYYNGLRKQTYLLVAMACCDDDHRVLCSATTDNLSMTKKASCTRLLRAQTIIEMWSMMWIFLLCPYHSLGASLSTSSF